MPSGRDVTASLSPSRARVVRARESRVDHVGSLLRPAPLLAARALRAEGTIDPAEFKRVEDDAVRHVVRLQEECGCLVVTDGELRRDSFQSEITAACEGFQNVTPDAWLWGDWHSNVVGDVSTDRPPGLAVVGRLRKRRNLAVEELTFLRSLTDRIQKVTLPSPSMLGSLWDPVLSRAAYPTLDDFCEDVTAVLVDEVRELHRLGCAYVQIDAPHYPLLIDPAWRAFYESRGWTIEDWLRRGIAWDNALIDAVPGMTFGFHLCRGNQRSRWLVSGSYEPIAQSIFHEIRAHRLLLEYDDERSGSFDPLRHVRDDQIVVLGLVTTKTPRVETVAWLTERIHAAARIVPLDRLALGTQCGFATSAEGNAIGEDDERRKLAVIAETAASVWG
jgi:5-methyltetrahydropteroyltriglutamate--homocysteine methyltransferase